MKVFATYNIKGGVGKTAAAVNLAYLCAREGARTLVWDLDPQGAASFYFRIKAKVKGGGKDLLRRKRDIDALVKGTDWENLDLLPADFSYRHMDLILDDTKKRTRHIRKLLKPLAEDYDVLFLDCPPSISLVSENVFEAAHALLIPMIPTTLSARTLEQLVRFLDKVQLNQLKLMPFFSMVDARKRLHREIAEAVRSEHPSVLAAQIPYASEVERMGVQRAPLGSFAARRSAALAFEALWAEVKSRL